MKSPTRMSSNNSDGQIIHEADGRNNKYVTVTGIVFMLFIKTKV